MISGEMRNLMRSKKCTKLSTKKCIPDTLSRKHISLITNDSKRKSNSKSKSKSKFETNHSAVRKHQDGRKINNNNRNNNNNQMTLRLFRKAAMRDRNRSSSLALSLFRLTLFMSGILLVWCTLHTEQMVYAKGQMVQNCKTTPSLRNVNEVRKFVDNCIKTGDNIRYRKRISATEIVSPSSPIFDYIKSGSNVDKIQAYDNNDNDNDSDETDDNGEKRLDDDEDDYQAQIEQTIQFPSSPLSPSSSSSPPPPPPPPHPSDSFPIFPRSFSSFFNSFQDIMIMMKKKMMKKRKPIDVNNNNDGKHFINILFLNRFNRPTPDGASRSAPPQLSSSTRDHRSNY